MKYLDLHSKENLISQTSFLPKKLLPGHSGLRGLSNILGNEGKSLHLSFIFIQANLTNHIVLNPKRCGLFGVVHFGEMKFVLSNFLSNEDLSISYEMMFFIGRIS